MCLIKLQGTAIYSIDNHHRRADYRCILIGLAQSLRKEMGTKSLALEIFTDCKTTNQGCADQGIARDMLLRRIRNSSGSNAMSTKCEVPGNLA